MINELKKEEYEKYGYCVIRDFISQSDISYYSLQLAWLVEQQLNLHSTEMQYYEDSYRLLSQNLIKLDAINKKLQGYIYDQATRMPFIHQLASSNTLISIAREILSQNIAIHSRINIIMAMPKDLWHLALWHQDGFYNQSNHLVAYIPLQFSDENNGMIKIGVGEHKNGLMPHEKIRKNNKWLSIPDEKINKFKNIKQLKLNAGDLLLFNGLTPHSAGVNKSTDVRFAITIRYSDLNDRFFKQRGWVWEDLSIEGLKAINSKEK